jgi:hypothetical protein
MGTDLHRFKQAAALALLVSVWAFTAVAGQDPAAPDKNKDKNEKTDKAKDKDKDDPRKHFAIISGTVFGPDDHSLYGVKVEVHLAGSTSGNGKHSKWELMSDHNGEFAVRVPPGPGDYVVEGEADYAPIEGGKIQKDRARHLKATTSVHVDFEERQDVSLHLR